MWEVGGLILLAIEGENLSSYDGKVLLSVDGCHSSVRGTNHPSRKMAVVVRWPTLVLGCVLSIKNSPGKPHLPDCHYLTSMNETP